MVNIGLKLFWECVIGGKLVPLYLAANWRKKLELITEIFSTFDSIRVIWTTESAKMVQTEFFRENFGVRGGEFFVQHRVYACAS